jgi:DnaD/phage-associated family protein
MMTEDRMKNPPSTTFEVNIGPPQPEKKHWLSMGYGLAPAMVLRDPNLSMGAKAVYAYLMTFTSSDRKDVWPGRDLILKELGCNKDTLAKYMAELSARGLVVIEQVREEGARFGHNIYRIMEWVVTTDQPCQRVPGPKSPCPKKPDTEKPEPVKPATNKTSLKQDHKSKQDHRRTDALLQGVTAASVGGGLSVDLDVFINDKQDHSTRVPEVEQATDPLQVVTQAFHRHVGVIGPSQFTKLRFWVEEMAMNPEVVAYGIGIAAQQKKADHHPPRISYIEGILRNWHNAGLATVDAVKAHEARLDELRQKRAAKSDMGMTREEAIAFLEAQDVAKEQALAQSALNAEHLAAVEEIRQGLEQAAPTQETPPRPAPRAKLPPALEAIRRRHEAAMSASQEVSTGVT